MAAAKIQATGASESAGGVSNDFCESGSAALRRLQGFGPLRKCTLSVPAEAEAAHQLDQSSQATVTGHCAKSEVWSSARQSHACHG